MRVRRSRLLFILEHNFRAEMEGAATYRAIAGIEPDKRRADIIRRMATNEEDHAKKWAARLKKLGKNPPPGPFTAKANVLFTARISSVDTALRKLEAMEDAHVLEYERQGKRIADPELQRITKALVKDERRHSQTLKSIIPPPHDAKNILDAIQKGEKHVSSGNWIGDAIYGINDGLGAVFGIVSGVSGATGGTHVVLLAGLAGTVASAVSMGSGAYLAAKSEREVREAELSREQREIREKPQEELMELALFYELKGLSRDEALYLAKRVAKDPKRMLEVLSQEELGVSPDNLPDPNKAAVVASVSTAIGAFIPIIPFFFLDGVPAILWAAGVSLAAHFLVGAAKSVITTRSWWASGLEMTLVGILAGIVTYAIGVLVGPLTH